MNRNRHPDRVEDYTNAFLGTFAVILFMGFWVIASLFGFFWVVATTAMLDLGIKRIMRSR